MAVGAQSTQGRRAAPERQILVRLFAFFFGLGYLIGGLLGFIETGFTGFVIDTDEVLLLFDINIFHNIVHIAIGAGLMLASRMRNVAVTQGVVLGVGLFYVVAALLGFLNELQIISINDSLAPDNFLHLISGAALVVVGVGGALAQEDEPRTPSLASSEGPLPLEQRRRLWDPTA